MCVCSILIVFLFNFAFEPGREESLRMLPGVVWIVFLFAGILGFNRSFAAERENACLEGMILAPIDGGAIYFGKLLSNLVFLAITECVVVFAVTLWYNSSFLPSRGAGRRGWGCRAGRAHWPPASWRGGRASAVASAASRTRRGLSSPAAPRPRRWRTSRAATVPATPASSRHWALSACPPLYASS